MPEPHHPYDIDADEADDLTTQFWGSSRGWTPRAVDADTTGEHTAGGWDERRTIRMRALKAGLTGVRERRLHPSNGTRRDDTGRIDRTRAHGTPRPAPVEREAPIQRVRVAEREATLGELAAGHAIVAPASDVWTDDEWLDAATKPTPITRRPEPRRPAARQAPSRRPQAAPAATSRDHDEYDEYDIVPLSSSAPLSQRLGLGAVDPLLARLGMIVLVGLLLVPIALMARSGGGAPSVASADLVGLPGVAQLPVTTVAPTTQAATAPVVAPAPVATTPATVAAASQALASTASQTAVAETAAPETTSAETSTTASAATAPPATLAQAATVNETAKRLEPVCALTYTAGFGDSWYRIADAAGVTPDAVMDANLASIESPIYPGDEICLPAGATIPVTPTTTQPPVETPATTAAPTTVAPATTAAPTTVSPAPSASQAQVQQMIRDIWPDELEQRALEIAYRESNYRATAHNGTCCYGVFQIYWTAHKSWLDDYGILSATDLYDAQKNITAAYALYQRAGGWGPWGG